MNREGGEEAYLVAVRVKAIWKEFQLSHAGNLLGQLNDLQQLVSIQAPQVQVA